MSETPTTLPRSTQWDTLDLFSAHQPDDLVAAQAVIEAYASGTGCSYTDGMLVLSSGGVEATDTMALPVATAVTETFTAQYRVRLTHIPADFTGLSQGVASGVHAYIGAWSSQDFSVGFFISTIGWAYTGEVSFDISGAIVPAQEVAIIPGSATWTLPGKEYVIRVVCDADARLVYVYCTRTDDVDGPFELKAVLVAKPTSSSVSDSFIASVKGSSTVPVHVRFSDYQLSSRRVIPDLAPVADAGADQTILKCSVLQLDGTSSVDPEGSSLSYEWRLVDAPLGSAAVISGGDGYTLTDTPATGFTSTFYSTELAIADNEEPLLLGDVLVLPSGSFTIKEITRTPSFSVRVEYSQLPDSTAGVQFRVLRQLGIAGHDTVKPTFYPDIPGFYTFDLRVYDGLSSSSPLGTDRSRVLVNVIESPLPRGCPVNVEFLYNNLLSFWQLVEDKDRISTFWEGLARVAATELYTLWQVEYAKSLRDIQRVLVRRWLHYDLLLPEPSPELTNLRFIWGGVVSSPILNSTVSGVGGTTLSVSSPFLPYVATIPLASVGAVTPEAYAQEIQARMREILGPSVSATVWHTRAELISAPITGLSFPAAVAGRHLTIAIDGGTELQFSIGSPDTSAAFVQELATKIPTASVTLTSTGALRIGSKRLGSTGTSSVVINRIGSTLVSAWGGSIDFSSDAAFSTAYVHITASIPFTFTSASTAPCFVYPRVNALIGSSSGGERVGARTFRASYSLVDASIKEDDLLVVGRDTYRIVRILDDVTDPFYMQRIIVKEDLPELTNTDWAIPGWVDSVFLDFWNGLIDRGDYADFEVVVPSGDGYITSIATATVLGANSTLVGRAAINTSELAPQLSLVTGTSTKLARVLRRRFIPIDNLIVDVPLLSDVIELEDTDAVLRRNVDFFLETFRGHSTLRFCTGASLEAGDVWEGERPPSRLWAEYTYVDNEGMIEANFGAAIGLTRDMIPDTVDYLSAVRGIWYARYNGPTLRNLRIALQVFLGLPFAEESGVIVEVRTDFLTQKGRILIQDVDNAEIVRSYTYPRVLSVETNPDTGVPYAPGDTVAQFAPLVTGAEVIDWVKNPKWFEGIVNQGIFYEVQKYHSFLVRIDSRAFSLQSLLFAQQFIQWIKPVYTNPLYVVGFKVSGDGEEIDVIDTVNVNVTLSLFDTPCDRLGASVLFDEPWAAGAAYGSSYRNSFDTDDDPATPSPVYPGPPDPVYWGFDKEWLCPESTLQVTSCKYFNAAIPAFDSVWSFDVGALGRAGNVNSGPHTYPYIVNMYPTVPAGSVISEVSIQLQGDTGAITDTDWFIDILVGSDVALSIPLLLGRLEWQMPGPTQAVVVTLDKNIDVHELVNIPVTVESSISIRIRPSSGTAQEAGWNWLYVNVYYATAWSFDTPMTGTYCISTEGSSVTNG